MTHRLAPLRSSVFRHARAWLHREGGAVTVDYVVLSAAVLGLGIAMHAVLNDPLAEVAGAVEGELSETDTTDEAGEYRPFDPEGWEMMLAFTRESYGAGSDLIGASVTVFAPHSDPDRVYVNLGTDDWYLYDGDPYAEFDLGLLVETDGSPADYASGEEMAFTLGGAGTDVATQGEVHDAMRNFLTEDEYSVLVGAEDQYAALQIVMEESGYDLPDGWPDFRSF